MAPTTFYKARMREIQLLLESRHGHIESAAKAIGVARSTMYAWIASCPELQETLEDIKHGIIDTLEVKLEQQALGGNLAAMRMYLNGPTGRKRGWGERTVGTVVESGKEADEVRDEAIRAIIPKMTLSQLRALKGQEDKLRAGKSGLN